MRPLDPDLRIEDRDKFNDEICLQLEKRKKLVEKQNEKKEPEPILQEDETVYVARPGIKSKTKPKFEAVKVKRNNRKTFIDSKGRKIHKNNIKRKNK